MTPEYAAPEQLTGAAVTTATDVHALGTLLYLLLAGQHPTGAARTSPALLLKAIVDTDPKRLSDAATDADASARSATRESLRRQLRGDLDTIVAKALKKDPAERYASVDTMAADVRRYLGHEPIGARPDAIGYRTAKFVRRHRAGVAAGALAAAALVAGTLAIVWQAREVRKQRDDARSRPPGRPPPASSSASCSPRPPRPDGSSWSPICWSRARPSSTRSFPATIPFTRSCSRPSAASTSTGSAGKRRSRWARARREDRGPGRGPRPAARAQCPLALA